jgi:hypothetical protein
VRGHVCLFFSTFGRAVVSFILFSNSILDHTCNLFSFHVLHSMAATFQETQCRLPRWASQIEQMPAAGESCVPGRRVTTAVWTVRRNNKGEPARMHQGKRDDKNTVTCGRSARTPDQCARVDIFIVAIIVVVIVVIRSRRRFQQ